MRAPKTPEEIRAFIGCNFMSLRYGRPDQKPSDKDTYTLSVHDLLSAFYWLDDSQEEES